MFSWPLLSKFSASARTSAAGFTVTASAEERARRRYKELIEKGEKVEYENVLAEMKQRDYNDSNRAIAPLRAAPDAITVDTTELSLDESIEKIKNVIKENL